MKHLVTLFLAIAGIVLALGDDDGCNVPLGLEAAKLSVRASSTHGSCGPATNIRLDGGGAWCAGKRSSNEFVIVDLKKSTTISGFITQGRANVNQWVTEYKVSTSKDGRTWTVVGTFTGNKDRSTKAQHAIKVPEARYFKLQALKWSQWPSMRMEILGCATLTGKVIILKEQSYCVNRGGFGGRNSYSTNVGRNQPLSKCAEWVRANAACSSYFSKGRVDGWCDCVPKGQSSCTYKQHAGYTAAKLGSKPAGSSPPSQQPSPPPSTVALPGYLGCYKDGPNRELPHLMNAAAKASVDFCKQYCKSKKYRYAGVQATTWCTCGNDYAKKYPDKRPESECANPCPADPKQKCGGTWRHGIYDTVGSSPPSQQPSPPPSTGTWKLVLHQRVPDSGCFFAKGEYRKNANDPQHCAYAILDEVADYITSDGRYVFKLKYDNGQPEIVWSQTSNPVTRATRGVDGFVAIKNSYSSFKGLENNLGVGALLDGTPNQGNWWFAVGTMFNWRGQIPAQNPLAAKEVWLWVQVPAVTGRPIDCEVGPYVFSGCSTECGSGIQTGLRKVLTPARFGGKCPSLKTTRDCNVKPCATATPTATPVPQACQLGDWQLSPCSKPCGGGTMTRYRVMVKEAVNGGRPCQIFPPRKFPCNTRPCGLQDVGAAQVDSIVSLSPGRAVALAVVAVAVVALVVVVVVVRRRQQVTEEAVEEHLEEELLA